MVPDQLNQNRFVLIGEEFPVQQSQNKKTLPTLQLSERNFESSKRKICKFCKQATGSPRKDSDFDKWVDG
jgi:hypothetical protein